MIRLLFKIFLFFVLSITWIKYVHAEVDSWNFLVSLDDKPIGYHRFTLTQKDGKQELKSEAHFEVKILFISAYIYDHNATELWKDNCLISMTSSTNDDGNRLSIDAKRENGKFIVTGNKENNTYSGCIMSFAYWNPAILLQTKLLNAQTGQYDSVHIVKLAETQLMINGKTIPAKHYRIENSAGPIELWYSADDDWLALTAIVKGGRRLHYQREN